MMSTNQNTNKVYLGYLLSLVGVIVLSFDTLLIRLVSDISYWNILFYRYLFHFLVCTIYNAIIYKKTLLKEIYNLGKLGILAVTIMSVCNACFTISIIYTTISNTLAIYAISPLMTSFFSWLTFKQKINWWTILILVAVVSTTLTVILYDHFEISNNTTISKKNNIIGCSLASIAMLTTAGYFTILRYTQLKYPSKQMVITTSLSGLLTTVVSIIGILSSNISFGVSKNIIWLFLQGSLVLPIAFITITLSTKYISGTESNMMILLETVLGPLWVHLVGIETPPKLTIIGIVIIVILLFINSIINIRLSKVTI
jgi:drug/metabolite transporter (DMT)-like permease